MKIEVKDLSIQEKIGQMIMVGMNTNNVRDKLKDLIINYKIGGVLLYQKNFKTYDELVDLVNYIKELNRVNKVPLFIAIDQEGGRVNRMPKEFKNLPSANKLAKINDEEVIEEAGIITGKMLDSVGINFNFAPVLDIKKFQDSHPIGDRAYSENVAEVAKCGISFMKGLHSNNIVSVLKHFPGHGLTKKDSHFNIPIVKKSIREIEAEDMKPFEIAIENGADSILVSHIIIKEETRRYPVSMSKRFIGKFLRIKYRFNGLIVTDDMQMKGIKTIYGSKRSIKKAFLAGNDIVVFKYIEDKKVFEKIINMVETNELKEYKINRSIKRILKIKEKYNINDKKIEKDLKLQEINDKIEQIRLKAGI